MEGGYIRNKMKSKLPRLAGEGHKEYQKRCIEHEKLRTEKKYAERRATIEMFEKIKRGEIEYKPVTHPLPARNAKGRTIRLKPKYGVQKYDI